MQVRKDSYLSPLNQKEKGKQHNRTMGKRKHTPMTTKHK